MKDLDTREWLLTNGLGSFASGTVCDARTRTYHGWLMAALEPPGRRTLLLSHLDASLEVAGEIWALSTNFWTGGKIDPLGYQLLRAFELEPVPTWIWGQEYWELTRQLVMPYSSVGSGESCDIGPISSCPPQLRQDSTSKQLPQFCNRILIQYRYEGSEVATLRLRPVIGDRDFHHQQSADEGLQFSQVVGSEQLYLQGTRASQLGMPWQLRWSAGNYQAGGTWYWNYYYPEENRRGLGDHEDLYSPGYLTVVLHPGDAVTLEARVGCNGENLPELNPHLFDQAIQTEQERQNQLFALVPMAIKSEKQIIWRQLLRAGDQFIAYRASIDGPTVIAGYPWFNDWGRDTLIAIPGLALATGRFAEAKGLLKTFGSYCRDGLIPNTFPDDGAQPIYNSIDASLWWIETLGLYLETTQDWDFLIQEYPVVRKIYKILTAGTLYNIRVDASDGLLIWEAPNVALTWMDVVIDGEPVTPRQGKPVEINALWYSALCWISLWTQKLATDATVDQVRLLHQAQHYAQQARKVKASLEKFWNAERNYFYDTLEPDDRRDARIRPNAVLALSLYHCGFPEEQARRVLLVARDRLLTPYGLRSLDPADPNYISYYSGDRLHRDKAYHQGTVWSWLIGPFVRAWKRFYPTKPIPLDWQPLLDHMQQQACLGSISEIFDGDPPHSPQGAIAQAWSVAELIRHYWDF
ncbi:MAG TPA: amylo-alpha-1,6-glucosidase [Coleofasciculaceae cyanobacterium]